MRIDIEQKHPSGTLKRAIAFIFDPRQIDDMEKDFARAMELYHVSFLYFRESVLMTDYFQLE